MGYDGENEGLAWGEATDDSGSPGLGDRMADRFGDAGDAMAHMMDEDPYFREMVSMCHTSEGGAAMWETLFTEAMDPDEDLVMVENFLDRLAQTARRIIRREGHLTPKKARRLLKRVADEEGLRADDRTS